MRHFKLTGVWRDEKIEIIVIDDEITVNGNVTGITLAVYEDENGQNKSLEIKHCFKNGQCFTICKLAEITENTVRVLKGIKYTNLSE